MGQRRRKLAAWLAIFLAAIICLVWLSGISFQPYYKGRPLSYWLTGYSVPNFRVASVTILSPGGSVLSNFVVSNVSPSSVVIYSVTNASVVTLGSTAGPVTTSSNAGTNAPRQIVVASAASAAGLTNVPGSAHVTVAGGGTMVVPTGTITFMGTSTTNPSKTWFTIGREKHTDVSSAQADEAVLALGGRTIPYLVKMLRVRDSAASRKWLALLNRQPFIGFERTDATVLHRRAIMALSALGTNAAPAAADLGWIYADTNSVRDRSEVVGVLNKLGALGKPATPGLLKSLDYPDWQLMQQTLDLLWAVDADWDKVVGRLAELVDSSRWVSVRANAAIALGWYGEASRSAVPVLKRHAHDDFTGDVMRQALREIGATNGP